tara:strand:+ start:73 stop:663 length:591 start_codon:yes stop_codon:yes gene_type:complete
MLTLHLKNLRFSHEKGGRTFDYDHVFASDKPIALRGESGTGKTTLLELIAGFLTPHHGEVFVEKKGAKKSVRDLSYLRQEAPLFEGLSVQKNIAFSRASLKEIYDISETLGISNLLEKRAGALSGGQSQRVLLAQTLLQKRPLLLLDEPFKGLDQDNKNKVISLIKKAASRENNMVIFTTHDPRDVDALGAREIIL